jgi:hypothetical protein
MEDKFIAGLENCWSPVAVAPGVQKYRINAFTNYGVHASIVSISYPKGDAAEAQFIALGDPDYFTDGVIYSIFKDLSMLIRHYGPGYKILKCDATFGDKTRKFGWYLDEVIKERSSK